MMTSSIEFVNDVIIEEIASAKVKQVYNWEELKKVISYKLNTIPSELVQCDLLQKSIKQLDDLIVTPFTIQRICELILMLDHLIILQNTHDAPNNENNYDTESSLKPNIKEIQYRSHEKLLKAVYKCLNVTGRCDDDILLYPLINIMDTS